MTDPQFGFSEANQGFEKETVLYEKAVDEVNRLNPDFVVITGDLVNKLTDTLQWAELDRITAKIKPSIPFYLLPGNHDIGNIPTQAQIDAFKESYGDDKFSFKHKKNWFIGLNSSIITNDTPELEEQQFLWLEKELIRAKSANNIIVFCHYPFFINEPDEPDKYFNIGIEKRKKYLELFARYKVNSVFAGHLHKNAYGQDGSLNMITTSAVGKPLGEDPSGLRIIVVSKDGVSSVYYGLEDIPEKVTYDINNKN
jgi:3',5'-cyclic AMP phosphodiesterase CpdA